MGYYIQTANQLRGKSLYIRNNYGGEIISTPPSSFESIPEGKALIVVIDNGMFEAAGLVYSPEEFNTFVTGRDYRPRQYVLMDKFKAHELAGYKEE